MRLSFFRRRGRPDALSVVGMLPRTIIVLAVLFYALVARPWHMHWGATDDERTLPLAGDPLMPRGSVVSTRALEIDAAPEEVWPWVARIGQERGGFFSHVWLENLFAAGMQNAETLDPSVRPLEQGDSITYQKDGPGDVASIVIADSTLVIGGGWTLALRRTEQGRTRLVVRYPYTHGGNVLHMLYYYAIFEPAHFVMESGMMLGIKERAERSHDQARRVDGMVVDVVAKVTP